MDRLEQHIFNLAQREPYLAKRWNPQEPDRVARMARYLAGFNILVIMGDFPQTLRSVTLDTGALIQTWVDGYTRFYQLLAHSLFPSRRHIEAQYADSLWPVIIIIRGEAAPVIEIMAGFVAPYIALRQADATISEIELLGLMQVILDALEAGTLLPEAQKRLLHDGAACLRQMLMASIRQLPVTEFDRRIFTDSERFIPLPPEPPSLPEEDSALLSIGQETRVDVTTLTPEQAAYTPPDTQTLTATQSVSPGDEDTPSPSFPATAPPDTNAPRTPPPMSTPPDSDAPPPIFPPPRRSPGSRRPPPVPRLPGDKDKD